MVTTMVHDRGERLTSYERLAEAFGLVGELLQARPRRGDAADHLHGAGRFRQATLGRRVWVGERLLGARQRAWHAGANADPGETHRTMSGVAKAIGMRRTCYDIGEGNRGVISPLLMNIALHGMEQALGVRYDRRGQIKGSRALVRYADDWVVFCESEQDAQGARRQAKEWLLKRGLRLSEDKTRIVHLCEGFDFLGFNVRHYPAPKTARSGYKLLIKPSKESVSNFKDRVRLEWMNLK